ncbi:MAG: ATP-binding protein [Verrucomicrobiota bacterium]
MRLGEHQFIRSIRADRRDIIIEEVEILNLEPNAPIFPEQSAPDALFLILEGSVVFTKEKPDGSLQNVSEASEGAFFGEVGVFTGESRALGARALTHAVIGRVPELTVKKIIEDAEPVRKILESVISHLRSTTDHYMDNVMHQQKLLMVGTMVSSILHDFKNPFAIISLGSALIKKQHPEDAKTARLCNDIETQIRRMVDMAKDLTAFSRGEEDIELSYVSFGQLFDYFRELNGPFFNDKDVSIRMESKDASFHGDASKLLRVLQNLVANSIEAIRQDNNTGEITILATQDEADVTLTISDNGPGIPEEIHEKFFEPFVTYGKHEGTGLGTAIVKSIVEAHEGRISFVTSDEGTTFTIRLPKTV